MLILNDLHIIMNNLRCFKANLRDFSARVTLKFNGWPQKTIGHLFKTTWSFVHHFKTIGEFKLELQSGNAQFGSKSAIFFVSCDLEIWRITLQNKRVPLLYHVKPCTSFQSHGWIQIGVTVRKRSIRVKISNFCPVWPWNLTGGLEKQQDTSSMLLQALCIIW